MSYAIFYNSMYVKTSNEKYIPMVLCGSSNSYEYHYKNGRRVEERTRNWTDFDFNGSRTLLTKKEILDSLKEWEQSSEQKREKYMQSDDVEKWGWAKTATFGYLEAVGVKSKAPYDTTFKMVEKIALDGFKNCIDVETAIKELHLKIMYYEKEYRVKYVYFKNEQEMLKEMAELEANGIRYWFMFDDDAANFYADYLKWVGNVTKKGDIKPFILELTDRNGKVSHLGVKGNQLEIVDNKEDAYVFTKYGDKKADLNQMVYKMFKDIRKISFRYLPKAA